MAPSLPTWLAPGSTRSCLWTQVPRVPPVPASHSGPGTGSLRFLHFGLLRRQLSTRGWAIPTGARCSLQMYKPSGDLPAPRHNRAECSSVCQHQPLPGCSPGWLFPESVTRASTWQSWQQGRVGCSHRAAEPESCCRAEAQIVSLQTPGEHNGPEARVHGERQPALEERTLYQEAPRT